MLCVRANNQKRNKKMDKQRAGYLALAAVALIIAGVLTYALLNPKDITGQYDYSVGSLPKGPSKTAVGIGIIQFQKTEE